MKIKKGSEISENRISIFTKNEMKSLNKKIIAMLILLVLSMILLMSGMYAYFTDAETKTNEFTVGRISIELQEPNWNPPIHIVPNQTMNKDPQIKNNGRNNAFVFLEVGSHIRILLRQILMV